MKALQPLWREHNDLSFTRSRLSNVAYEEAVAGLVIVCSDILIVSKVNGEYKLFLAKRKAKPLSDWWCIGGRRNAGEDATQAAARCFKRETKLELAIDRFKYVGQYEYLFADRQQAPQNMPCHSLIFDFIVELSPEELRRASLALDVDEYHAELGFKPFTLRELQGMPGIYANIAKIFAAFIGK